MNKSYFRPVSFVYGRDARGFIEAGRAGALGGFSHVGFTHVEVIERGVGRVVEAFADVSELPEILNITKPRRDFGGLAMSQTRVMGIVNVTPDSFSDGGRLDGTQAGIAHGLKLAAEGADILDVGGESTRPGSDTVSVAEEIARVDAVIAELSKHHIVSADTRKSEVMAVALNAGAKIINDVSALNYDDASSSVVAKAQAQVILMHAQGEPKTMQLNPRYDDVLLDVYDALAKSVARAMEAGIQPENICVDPGIGFGKSFKQNLELMAGLSLFHGLGVPVLVGLSRKGFVGAVTGEKVAADRAHGSVGGALQAAMHAAHILRVHDVKATVHGMKVFTASSDPDSVDL